MSLFFAILKAITAGLCVWKQERSLQNSPELIKAAAAQAIQDGKDKLAKAEAVLADPTATQEQHLAALREIRLANS